MPTLPGKALILVENLSVPFDRRVWQESTTLRDAGWEVHVICPQGTTPDTRGHYKPRTLSMAFEDWSIPALEK